MTLWNGLLYVRLDIEGAKGYGLANKKSADYLEFKVGSHSRESLQIGVMQKLVD